MTSPVALPPRSPFAVVRPQAQPDAMALAQQAQAAQAARLDAFRALLDQVVAEGQQLAALPTTKGGHRSMIERLVRETRATGLNIDALSRGPA